MKKRIFRLKRPLSLLLNIASLFAACCQVSCVSHRDTATEMSRIESEGSVFCTTPETHTGKSHIRHDIARLYCRTNHLKNALENISAEEGFGRETLDNRISKLEEQIYVLNNDVASLIPKGEHDTNCSNPYFQNSVSLDDSSLAPRENVEKLETAVRSLMQHLQDKKNSNPIALAEIPQQARGAHILKSGTHKVRAGDTLGSIARNNGTTILELQAVNNIKDCNRIIVGQELVIP